jgi:hypothetical protein
MKQIAHRSAAVAFVCLAIVLVLATPARAQHGDYPLGTAGILGAQQAPEGLYYSNVWSYYHASGSAFAQTGPLKCGKFDHVCASLNVGGSGSLDLFIDQNFFGWTTPLKILGANYGFFVDVPFAIADASGAASLEPILTLKRATIALASMQKSGGATKGSIGDIYFEPVNIGWHFKQLDAIVSSGVVMPSGPFNANARVNIGYGHWTGLFGLGGVGYFDAERTWSLSIYLHYELYGAQMGRPYNLGDAMPFEWGAGKSLNLSNDILKQLTIGAVGYAQWQITANQIDVHPSSAIGMAAVNRLESVRAQVYSAGPSITALTKFGLFAIRYYEEFDAHATPSGRQLMFTATIAGNPFSK